MKMPGQTTTHRTDLAQVRNWIREAGSPGVTQPGWTEPTLLNVNIKIALEFMHLFMLPFNKKPNYQRSIEIFIFIFGSVLIRGISEVLK